MGACFSLSELEDPYPTAQVISANGDLHEYPVPVTVSLVLQSEIGLSSNPDPSPSPSPSPSPLLSPSFSSTGYFVCNSDRLYYEERIPALEHGEGLVGNQIYFVLPASKLDCRLTAQEMAALAVKASLALQKAEEKGGSRRRRSRKASIRISPVVEACEGGGYGKTVMMNGGYYGNVNEEDGGRSSSNSVINGSVLRSGSFRKTQRVMPSKRAKIAVRPYRLRLSTIHEGTDI